MTNNDMLKHWQFEKLPFVNRPIKEDSDDIFANRKTKLDEIAFAEGHGLVCLYGVQGIGKTSLFYKYGHSVRQRKNEKTDFLYTEIVPQKDRVLIQILRSILVAIENNTLHVDKKSKLKIKQKLGQIDRRKNTTDTLLGKVRRVNFLKYLWILGQKQAGKLLSLLIPLQTQVPQKNWHLYFPH